LLKLLGRDAIATKKEIAHAHETLEVHKKKEAKAVVSEQEEAE